MMLLSGKSLMPIGYAILNHEWIRLRRSVAIQDLINKATADRLRIRTNNCSLIRVQSRLFVV